MDKTFENEHLALRRAIEMLKQIAYGHSYPASEYWADVRAMEAALRTDPKQ